MRKEKRISLYKKIWCKIRYWQNLKDISDSELAAYLNVGERTLHEYDKSAKNITLEKIDNFLYVNDMELADCCLPRKIQKIDKQNTKNKPPKLRKSAAYLLNKWLYKAKFQRCYTYSLKNSRQNSRIVEKHFLFCEHYTNSAFSENAKYER